MNNPPSTEPIEQETEHYAPQSHDVSKHVRGYLMVGATLLIFTAIFVLGLFWLTYLAWYDPVVH